MGTTKYAIHADVDSNLIEELVKQSGVSGAIRDSSDPSIVFVTPNTLGTLPRNWGHTTILMLLYHGLSREEIATIIETMRKLQVNIIVGLNVVGSKRAKSRNFGTLNTVRAWLG